MLKTLIFVILLFVKPSLQAETISNAGITSFTLDNGFKVILVPFPNSDTVRADLVVKVGSKMEGYGETGMAHLLEHMLFKSAGDRPDVKAALTKVGARWNGTTTVDRTNYFGSVEADPDKLDELLRIESDQFLRSNFTKEHLASEMTVVRNEMEQRANSPYATIQQALLRQSFSWHGYGHPTIGTKSDVEDAPFEVLKAFHDKYYRPDNAFLIVAGKFDEARVVVLVNELFSKAKNPNNIKIKDWTQEPSLAIVRRSELAMESGQTLAALAWRLPADYTREQMAFDMATNAICNSSWGSLRKNLVLDTKLAEDVSCSVLSMKDASLFVAGASGKQDGDPSVLANAVVSHIEQKSLTGITADELSRIKTEEANGFVNAELSLDSMVAFLTQAEVSGDWRLFFWAKDTFKEISLEEANAALKKYLAPYARSEVLLRHATAKPDLAMPPIPTVEERVKQTQWSKTAPTNDNLPVSWEDMKKATEFFTLADGAKAAIITRKTKGDKIWLSLSNHFGNPEYLFRNDKACAAADSLMVFGGGGYDTSQLNEAMERLNAKWVIGLDGISLEVPKAHLEEAFAILVKVWRSPSLPEDEFVRLKAAALTAVDATITEPDELAGKERAYRFDNYPEGHPNKVKSFEETRALIQDMQYADLKHCAVELGGLSYYHLTVTGPMSRDEVVKLWHDHIEHVPKAVVRYERVKALPPNSPLDTSFILVQKPNKPNASIGGIGLLPITDLVPDFAGLRLAFTIMGTGSNSRMWTKLREQEGLAYSAGSSLSPNSFDPRTAFSFFATVASANYPKALSMVQDEVQRALAGQFTEQEVEDAKKEWFKNRKVFFSSEDRYSGFVAGVIYQGRDFDFVQDYDVKIARLTAKEVTETFKKYVKYDKIVWAVGGGVPN